MSNRIELDKHSLNTDEFLAVINRINRTGEYKAYQRAYRDLVYSHYATELQEPLAVTSGNLRNKLRTISPVAGHYDVLIFARGKAMNEQITITHKHDGTRVTI